MVAAVVFDFDGTLIDSAALKRAGYRAGMAAVGITDTPEMWAAYDLHRFSNRRILLSACFTDIFGREPASEQAQLLYVAYTDHVTSHPEQVQVFPGIARFHERGGSTPLFISSNAPMDEVRTTCEWFGFRKYFTDILGYPISKAEAIVSISVRIGADVGAVLYVGDHPGDCHLAASVGARFLHLDPPGEFLSDVPGNSLRSLDELGDVLYGGDV